MSGRGGPDEAGGGTWLPLTEAAPRLGVPSAEALRWRIRRGRCPHPFRRSNAGAWEVFVPDGLTGWVEPDVPAVPDASTALVAELRERVAVLERRIDEGHAERLKLLAMVADLTAQLAREREADLAGIPARSRPGLIPWLRRALWGGEG